MNAVEIAQLAVDLQDFMNGHVDEKDPLFVQYQTVRADIVQEMQRVIARNL